MIQITLEMGSLSPILAWSHWQFFYGDGPNSGAQSSFNRRVAALREGRGFYVAKPNRDFVFCEPTTLEIERGACGVLWFDSPGAGSSLLRSTAASVLERINASARGDNFQITVAVKRRCHCCNHTATPFHVTTQAIGVSDLYQEVKWLMHHAYNEFPDETGWVTTIHYSGANTRKTEMVVRRAAFYVVRRHKAPGAPKAVRHARRFAFGDKAP